MRSECPVGPCCIQRITVGAQRKSRAAFLFELRVRDKELRCQSFPTRSRTSASAYDDCSFMCAMMNDLGCAPNPTKGIDFCCELLARAARSDDAEVQMKTALITGATDGIGRETAWQLLAGGWRVLVQG